MVGKVPYYQDARVTIYCDDADLVCDDIHADSVRLLLTDPPYGNDYKADHSRSVAATSKRYPPIHGNNEPFDPTHLMKYKRKVIFGANYFAHKLPPSTCWIVWDKLAGLESGRIIGFNDSADCELAWTNFYGPPRMISHRWMGMLRSSERGHPRYHPNQKPVHLMHRLIAAYSYEWDVVYDPYMGSGPTAIACLETNRKFIGVEISEEYCKITVERIARWVTDQKA